MARSHYVIDLFYLITEGSDRLRREVLRIEAADDDAALAEGQRIDSWRKPHSYQIRAIHNSSRAGDKVVYTSPVRETAEDAADTAADNQDEQSASLALPHDDMDATTTEPASASALQAAKAGE